MENEISNNAQASEQSPQSTSERWWLSGLFELVLGLLEIVLSVLI